MNNMGLRCMSLLAIMILLGLDLPAQPELFVRKNKPTDPPENTWFCNPYDNWKMERFHGGSWEVVDLPMSEAPRLWHGLLMIIYKKQKSLVSPDGKYLWVHGQFIFAKDSICGAYDANSNWLALNYRGDTLGMYKAALPGELLWVKLGGELGLCIPLHARGAPEFWDVDIHNWGILGERGKWLIPPIFDAPFRFENGRAQVLQYGAVRTIDEQGKFVD